MPDRILRDELLESDRWLGLVRNTHRLAFVCLIPRGDPLGNLEANDGHLWRLWRDPLKLDSRQAIPEILESLVAVDLIRLYEVIHKRYIHIPRYRQELRYLGRICPPSPWTTKAEKQRLEKNSRRDNDVRTRESPIEVEVKRSEEKRSEAVMQNPNNAEIATEVKPGLEGMKVKIQKPKQLSKEDQLAFVQANKSK